MSSPPSDKTFIPDSTSPFHKGEQRIQHQLGLRDQMEHFGRKIIRDYMPAQHRAFYRQLPFVFAGHADAEGWPWASMLFGKPGFIETPHHRRLVIRGQIVPGDPLENNCRQGLKLGLLGIELPTRRRNRMAATVTGVEAGTLALRVDQAFGNCPQYIQTRTMRWLKPDEISASEVLDFNAFDPETRGLIERSDTFFVASYVDNQSGAASEGADVSHRGGKTGFVRVDNTHALTIPDYFGNNLFNTLGNILENERAGLLFIDFANGHVLTMTGRAEILWDSDEAEYFEGAQRLWRFHLHKGRMIRYALPMRWTLDAYSPNSLMTGSWREAEETRLMEARRQEWLYCRVTRIEDENHLVRSIYLVPENSVRLRFEPGQFLTLRAEIAGRTEIRTYTLSSAPADEEYRISVKREANPESVVPNGVFSHYLHDELEVGDRLEARSPTGTFVYDASESRPAVLLAGGVGITPMMSMMRHTLNEAVRTRLMRSVTLFAAAYSVRERAFFEELSRLQEQSGNRLRTYWALSTVDDRLIPGRDYHHVGRISAELLQSVLPLDDYDFYLCGPPGFMQHCYDLLRELGVSDKRILAEAFGPASLQRTPDVAKSTFEAQQTAEDALVRFQSSGIEQVWTAAEGTLLEFSEAHGMTPDFACRSGKCGACKVPILSGEVAYEYEPAFDLEENEALLCCAKPAATGEGRSVITLGL